jgi:hypothetical protein
VGLVFGQNLTSGITESNKPKTRGFICLNRRSSTRGSQCEIMRPAEDFLKYKIKKKITADIDKLV